MCMLENKHSQNTDICIHACSQRNADSPWSSCSPWAAPPRSCSSNSPRPPRKSRPSSASAPQVIGLSDSRLRPKPHTQGLATAVERIQSPLTSPATAPPGDTPPLRVCFLCCHGGRGPCGFSPARPELANPTTLLTKCRAAYLQREGPARAQRRWELAAQGLQRQSAALWPEQRYGWDEALHTTAQHYQADSEDHGALHVLHRVR